MQQSPIFTKTYDLLTWLLPATTKFPREHRFVMAKAVQETALPDGFVPGNTVGINLSPMAMEREQVPGMAFENYACLIRPKYVHP